MLCTSGVWLIAAIAGFQAGCRDSRLRDWHSDETHAGVRAFAPSMPDSPDRCACARPRGDSRARPRRRWTRAARPSARAAGRAALPAAQRSGRRDRAWRALLASGPSQDAASKLVHGVTTSLMVSANFVTVHKLASSVLLNTEANRARQARSRPPQVLCACHRRGSAPLRARFAARPLGGACRRQARLQPRERSHARRSDCPARCKRARPCMGPSPGRACSLWSLQAALS